MQCGVLIADATEKKELLHVLESADGVSMRDERGFDRFCAHR